MTNLIKVQNGKLLVSSREVAENFGKRHNDIVRLIDEKVESLTTQKFTVEKYFISSVFMHNGNTYDKYLLTRDGFSFIVMGFTGSKADIWKLKYIEAFNKMEETIKTQIIPNNLSPQLQLLINIEMKQKESDEKQRLLEIANNENKKEIENMRDVIRLDTTSWRTDTAQLISKMAMAIGGFEHIKDTRQKSYELLDQRMGVSLSTRLTNKRRRMAEEGVSKSKRDKLNYLDIISEDKKLIEGYVAIIKEMAIKFNIA